MTDIIEAGRRLARETGDGHEGETIARLCDGIESLQSEVAQVDELAMLVCRLARSLKKHNPGNDLADKAMDYVSGRGLQGSTMRQKPSAEFEAAWEEFTESEDCWSTGVAAQNAFLAGWVAMSEVKKPAAEGC